MWPFGGKGTTGLTRSAVLGAVPKKSPAVEAFRAADGSLTLTVRRADTAMARTFSLFLAVPRKRTFELDERGEWLWERCDGRRTVAKISQAVADRYEMEQEAAREAVFKYIGILLRRGLIVVETRKD